MNKYNDKSKSPFRIGEFIYNKHDIKAGLFLVLDIEWVSILDAWGMCLLHQQTGKVDSWPSKWFGSLASLKLHKKINQQFQEHREQ